MTLPQNSEGMFELEVLAPYNDSARMKLCDVRIAAQGLNVPCFEETVSIKYLFIAIQFREKKLSSDVSVKYSHITAILETQTMQTQ